MEKMKNKLLPAIFVFLLILFIMTSVSFADSSILDNINNDVLSHYYTGAIHIVCSTSNGYTAYMLDGTKVTISVDENNYIKFNSTGFTRNVYYYYDNEGNYLSYDNGTTMSSGSEIITDSTNENYLYSSVTIYNSKGEIVNPYQPVLFQITQAEQIPETMNKVLQIIIPVGLKILLVGLIIFLIRWVILRVT